MYFYIWIKSPFINYQLQIIKESYKGIVLDDELIKLIIDPTSCTKLIETLEDMLDPNKELSPANPNNA